MGLLDLQDCELDDETEAPAVEQRERRATIEEVNDDEQEEFTPPLAPTTRAQRCTRPKEMIDRRRPRPWRRFWNEPRATRRQDRKRRVRAGHSRLGECSANLGQWFGGTIVEAENLDEGTCRVVFLDGGKEDVSSKCESVGPPSCRTGTSKHQGPIKSRYVADVQSKANTHRSVLQFDLESGALIAQFVSARRAVDNVPSLNDPQEVLACCKGTVGTSGRLQWTFAKAPRPKLDAADVQELIGRQLRDPDPAAKPEEGRHQVRCCTTSIKVRNLSRTCSRSGARRADIPYDISHGWVTLVDPTLQKRFSPPPTAAAPDPRSKKAVEDDEEPGTTPWRSRRTKNRRRTSRRRCLPRPPPSRARRGGAVNYADPGPSIIVSELPAGPAAPGARRTESPSRCVSLMWLLGAARDAGLFRLVQRLRPEGRHALEVAAFHEVVVHPQRVLRLHGLSRP